MGKFSWRCWLFLAVLWVALSPEQGFPGMNPLLGFPTAEAYGLQIDNNVMSAMCVNCHTKTPVGLDNSSKGSHFVFLDTDNPTQNTSTWEKITTWDNTTFSKYGSTPTANQAPGVPGEMICESCHSLLKNTGAYKLLASDTELSDPNPLCTGCHAVGTMPGHHPLTGDPIYTRGNLPLSTTAGSALSTPLDNATYPGPDKVNCRSCHRVHGAQTGTGARLLKKGIGAGVTGAGVTGVERQFDHDPTGTSRLVTDFTPLCASCHTN